MRLTLPDRLKFTVPARKVVLLPDTHFFCRTVPVSLQASTAEVSAQVEMALEGLAPFPIGQMYYGHYWKPGARHALVFASYRKRFPTEQIETWSGAEAVLPFFATLLGAKVEGSTTLLYWTEKSVTALRWEDAADVPVGVHSRELSADAKPEERAALREELLRATGATIHVVESETAPVLVPATSDDSFHFRLSAHDSLFTREEIDVLDVRDKEELSQRRRARARDLILWRGLLGCAATLILCLVLEATLFGLGLWQEARKIRQRLQEPYVTKIMLAQNLTQQVEDRSTRRLRPFEMISLVSEKLPASILFTSATIKDLTLDVQAQTSTSTDIEVFRAALVGMPACEHVDFPSKDQRSQNGISTFRVIVTFRQSAFQNAPQS